MSKLIKEFNQENKEGIPKERLKALIKEFGFTPGINMALFIAAGALGKKTTWTGSDYGEHWLRVSGIGHGDLVSNDQKIIGILHDVLEDSDWTAEDLEEVGFPAKIVESVKSVSKNEGEKYLDATKRASIDPDGRQVKMRDNKDNMDLTRSVRAASDKQKYLYHISYSYLRAVEDKVITPNFSIWKFLKEDDYAGLINQENAQLIANSTSEPIPAYFRQKFNFTAAKAQAIRQQPG